MDDSDSWYFDWEGRTVGPLTPEQLRELIISGDLSEGKTVWQCEDGDQSFPAVDVVRLSKAPR